MNPFPRLGRGLCRLAGLDRTAPYPVRPLLAVLCVVVTGATAVWAGTRNTPVDDTVGDVARVGVNGAESVPGYLARSRTELDRLAAGGPVWALAGFDSYRTPVALDALLAGYQAGRVVIRVPLPGVQTQIVTLVVDRLRTDVPAGMLREATRKRADAAALETATPELAVTARREADAYARLCACAYAAVVRDTPARLRVLAGRSGIRVVDPVPEVTRLDRAVFVPLLPEQTTVVGPPSDVPSR